MAKSLGLTREDAEFCHPASPWKARLVGRVQKLSRDPDIVLSTWLEKGAPMGLACPIVPGGLFPTQEEAPQLTLDDLADAQIVK